MNIWIIQTGERLPLEPGARMMRSGLLARELAGRGHAVTWWTSAFDHYRRDWIDPSLDGTTLEGGARLRLLHGLGYRANLSLRRFADHALVARRFARAARQAERPDIIVAAMPDYRIAYAAYRFARAHDIPFVLDLRDRWPWDFLEHVPDRLHWLARAALGYDFRMARTLIAGSDSLVTMMGTWADWIEREGGRPTRPADRVFHLGAERPRPDDGAVGEDVRKVLAQSEGRWPLLFIGAFTNRSWPREAVEVFRTIDVDDVASRPLLILAGDGDRRAELEALVGGHPDIVLPGYVNDAEIAALLSVSKAGLVTLNGDYEAMPNKVFTYLSGGLPLLASISGELAKFVAETGVGLNANSPNDLARAMAKLMDDEELRGGMAARAQAVFDRRFAADALYADYADHVEAVAAARRLG